MAGIDEAVDRHAQETDKVDLATLKQLKRRVNALEEQIYNDKQKQLSVSFPLFLHCVDPPSGHLLNIPFLPCLSLLLLSLCCFNNG